MTLSASETYQQLIKKLHGSHLHFCLSETPFSAQICIRKRFLKGEIGPSSDFYHDEAISKNVGLSDIKELQKNEDKSSEIIELLETKLAAAEAQALKAFEEKKTEIDALKNALKNSEYQIVNKQKALEAKNKDLKEKEKVIKKLELKNENMNINTRNLKSELAKAKSECKKLQKTKSSNTVLDPVLTIDPLESDQPYSSEDANENLIPQCSYQSPSRTPPGTPPCLKTSTSSEVSNPSCIEAVTVSDSSQHNTLDCFICDETFPKVELLSEHTEKDHDLKLCPIKLTVHEKEEPFIRFFKSMDISKDYIKNRKQYYPDDWDQVEDRIRFRKLAETKLRNTSRQIGEKIEKTEFKSITRFYEKSQSSPDVRC